jgi:hypothetical protein
VGEEKEYEEHTEMTETLTPSRLYSCCSILIAEIRKENERIGEGEKGG